MTPSSVPAGGSAQSGGRAYAGRRPELEDSLNRYLYHPLAFRLARMLQPTGISPNAVSGVSGALVCLAAVFYTQVSWPVGVLAGFAYHLSWHVVDGADGDLARLTGKASATGEFIDGAADYLSHIVLYVLLAAMLDNGPIGGWAWVLATVAGVSRIVQANHAETQRRQYLWRVYGVPWLRSQQAAGNPVFGERGWFSRSLALVLRGYLALGGWMAPYSAPLDHLLKAAGNGGKQTELRARMQRAFHGSLLVQKTLSANPRTILLGLCMIADSPVWFFLIEAVVLNGVLLASIVYNNAVERRLLAELH
ncbi:MAG: CDP-alcohol phosphatidyltransferase family protein [Croceibacterium sp.]